MPTEKKVTFKEMENEIKKVCDDKIYNKLVEENKKLKEEIFILEYKCQAYKEAIKIIIDEISKGGNNE